MPPADAPEVVDMMGKDTELNGWQPVEEMIPKENLRSEVEAWARRIKVEPKLGNGKDVPMKVKCRQS